MATIHLRVALCAAAVCFASIAQAQQFPSKPVRIVLPFSAGSGPDTVIRMVGDNLGRAWGQPWVIENRPGANGRIAVDAVKGGPADGHLMLLVDNATMALQPHLYKNLPYDPVKDFDAVAPVYGTHFFIAVPATSRWTSVADLIEEARAKRGQLTYGSWGIGSVGHVGAALLEAATGTQMTHVPFKDFGQLYGAVSNSDVAWAFGAAGTAGGMQRAGKVRFLALAAPQRLGGEWGQIPTVGEARGPGQFELRSWVALFAPRGLPAVVRERLESGVAAAMNDPATQGRLTVLGANGWPGDANLVNRTLDADSKMFGDIVRRTKISLD